jgi:putative transposase
LRRQCPPELRPGDIVILDLAAGARLAFLPPYSPDFAPIEQVFAKVKHWLRNGQARSTEAIHDHVARLVGAIAQSECAN